MPQKILVTGGLGFIGSHTVVELQEEGYEVIIIDNLSNSSKEVLKGIFAITGIEPKFYELDLRDYDKLKNFYDEEKNIEGVIHFAASKAVGESVENPLLYYENNINTLVYLLKEMTKLQSQNLIFSSSCTVYGQAKDLPIKEDSPVQPAESPYGNTKQIGEEIIKDLTKSSETFHAISLRYFNPIGAHASSKIGELPLGIPQNLVPYLTQTVVGLREKLSVFGNDYPTPDGTCIRDYIHVVDLAKAHVVALKRLLENKATSAFEVFNVGTGKGSSVLEVINTFEEATGKKVNYQIAARREGDVVAAYADTSKSNEILHWKAQYTLAQALKSAWEWEKNIRKLN